MITVLVTGAAGFIGSQLCLKLLETGYKVIGVDNFDPFYPRSTKELNLQFLNIYPGFIFLEANILDSSTYFWLENYKIDAIAHLAAKAGVRNSMVIPAEYYNVNVLGTSNILEFARKQGINKIVMASSSSVYGLNSNFPWKESDDHTLPVSPYAASKKAAEILAESYALNFGLEISALRYFTVYGPGQRPDLAIYSFASSILNQTPITLYGDGSSLRSYTYVGDIVKGTIAALLSKIKGFEIFNLGSKETITLSSMLARVENAIGSSTKIIYEPLPRVDVPITWPDLSKAKAMLGFEPSTSFEEGLQQFALWFKAGFSLQVA